MTHKVLIADDEPNILISLEFLMKREGHQVLVAPPWIKGVNWSRQSVSVDLSRASIKNAPVYDPAAVWSSEQDLSLYQHHGRSGYWAGSTHLEREI